MQNEQSKMHLMRSKETRFSSFYHSRLKKQPRSCLCVNAASAMSFDHGAGQFEGCCVLFFKDHM